MAIIAGKDAWDRETFTFLPNFSHNYKEVSHWVRKQFVTLMADEKKTLQANLDGGEASLFSKF